LIFVPLEPFAIELKYALEQNPSHDYSGHGIYTVELTVQDNDGAQGNVSMFVAIQPEGMGTISGIVVFPADATDGLTATIKAIGSGGQILTTTSDDDGNYLIPGVPYDIYSVGCIVQGYVDSTRLNVVVDGDETVNFQLNVLGSGVLSEATVVIEDGEITESTMYENNDILVRVIASGSGVLTIKKLDPNEITGLAGPIPDELKSIGLFLEIELDDLDWLYIELTYDETDIPPDVAEEDLKLYFWNNATFQWEVVASSGAYTTENILWANVTHLTIFGVMATESQEDTGEGEKEQLNGAVIIGVIITFFAILCLAAIIMFVRKRPKEGVEDESEDEDVEESDEDEDEEINEDADEESDEDEDEEINEDEDEESDEDENEESDEDENEESDEDEDEESDEDEDEESDEDEDEESDEDEDEEEIEVVNSKGEEPKDEGED